MFKEFRLSHGLTQGKAGQLIGVSSSYWSNLENGKISPETAKYWGYAIQYMYNHDVNLDVVFSADKFKEHIKEHGYTLQSASFELGLGKSTISNILSNPEKRLTLKWRILLNAFARSLNELPAKMCQTEEVQVVSMTFDKIHPIMIDDEPFWIVADVCRAIDYKNPSMAISLIDDIDLKKHEVDLSKGAQWVCNESGLYQLLIGTKVPKAKPFRRWVTSEVLPSIRKTGEYSVTPANPIDAMILSLEQLKQVQAQQAQMQQEIKQIRESAVTMNQAVDIAKSTAEQAQAEHNTDLYYLDKSVKAAANAFAIKLHGKCTEANQTTFKGLLKASVVDINSFIKSKVAQNYKTTKDRAPGRQRYSKADKRTAYEAINAWRALHGLPAQMIIDFN